MAQKKTQYRVNAELVENIKKARLEGGYSQVEFAEGMGVSRSTYIRLENGQSRIFTPIFEKTMKKLGKTPYVSIGGYEEGPERVSELMDSISDKDAKIASLEEEVGRLREMVSDLEEKNDLLKKLNKLYEQELNKK